MTYRRNYNSSKNTTQKTRSKWEKIMDGDKTIISIFVFLQQVNHSQMEILRKLYLINFDKTKK